jgi:hypothetical protein
MKDKIIAISKTPEDKYGRYVEIENTLSALQEAVDGNIETVTLADLVIICNEEGRMHGLKPNCKVAGFEFVGNILVVGQDGENFTDCPIALEEWMEMVR